MFMTLCTTSSATEKSSISLLDDNSCIVPPDMMILNIQHAYVRAMFSQLHSPMNVLPAKIFAELTFFIYGVNQH